MKIIKIILTLLLIILLSNELLAKNYENVVSKLTTHSKALSKKEIKKLSKMLNKTRGTKEVGKILDKMKLPNEVLEDTYLRLAIYKKIFNKKEAEELMQYLKGTPGFRTTLKKIIGISNKKSRGHLNELNIAKKAYKNGFKIMGIGKNFKDKIKKNVSDIDLLLKKKGKIFAIEAKDYINPTTITTAKIEADMKTLKEFTKLNKGTKVIPIFTITKKPKSEKTLKRFESIARQNGVELIYGTPQEQIEQIKLLGEIY